MLALELLHIYNGGILNFYGLIQYENERNQIVANQHSIYKMSVSINKVRLLSLHQFNLSLKLQTNIIIVVALIKFLNDLARVHIENYKLAHKYKPRFS